MQESVCATKSDENGVAIDGSWGFCGPDCPTHKETFTWRKDKTFKISLQYNNDALWTGLDFFFNLLSQIFFFGLLLIIILTVTGNTSHLVSDMQL